MNEEFKLITEGVLVLASSQSLKNKYSRVEFDYSFPSGLAELLNNNSIIALTTSDGDDLNIKVREGENLNRIKYDKFIEQTLHFTDFDELLILSHAEFTMICSNNKGDYKNYGWPLKFNRTIEQGYYHVQIGITDTSEDFEKYNGYFMLEISISKSDQAHIANEVFEIGY